MKGRNRIPGTSGGGVGSKGEFVPPLLNIVGDVLTLTTLTDKLEACRPMNFGLEKIDDWLRILKDMNGRPTIWGRPTAEGTKVYFETIQTAVQAKLALDELMAYVGDFNRRYDTGIRIEGSVLRTYGQG